MENDIIFTLLFILLVISLRFVFYLKKIRIKKKFISAESAINNYDPDWLKDFENVVDLESKAVHHKKTYRFQHLLRNYALFYIDYKKSSGTAPEKRILDRIIFLSNDRNKITFSAAIKALVKYNRFYGREKSLAKVG